MKESKNKEVQSFIDEVLLTDSEKHSVLNMLRKVVFKSHTNCEEAMKYGGIVFSTESGHFGGVFVSKKHVSFEFSAGHLMKDPKKLLEGTGKYRRHLKITSLDDVDSKDVAFFVKQVR